MYDFFPGTNRWITNNHWIILRVDIVIRIAFVNRILEEAYDHLVEDGQLVIVIQKKQGAPSAQKKMQEVFGNVERIALDKGYWILVSTKEKGE